MTFKELARIEKQKLEKQPPITLKEARKKVMWLENRKSIKKKKPKN